MERLCRDCIYYNSRRYKTIQDDRLLGGCDRLAKGTTTDEYNPFGDCVYRGDKSCWVENQQINLLKEVSNETNNKTKK